VALRLLGEEDRKEADAVLWMTSRIAIALALAASVALTPAANGQPPVPPQSVPPVPTGSSPAEPAPSIRSSDLETALTLLDRIDTVVDAARKDALTTKPRAVATSGEGAVATSREKGASMNVTLDRAALDEIRAEIAQIKLLLQPPRQP